MDSKKDLHICSNGMWGAMNQSKFFIACKPFCTVLWNDRIINSDSYFANVQFFQLFKTS